MSKSKLRATERSGERKMNDTGVSGEEGAGSLLPMSGGLFTAGERRRTGVHTFVYQQLFKKYIEILLSKPDTRDVVLTTLRLETFEHMCIGVTEEHVAEAKRNLERKRGGVIGSDGVLPRGRRGRRRGRRGKDKDPQTNSHIPTSSCKTHDEPGSEHDTLLELLSDYSLETSITSQDLNWDDVAEKISSDNAHLELVIETFFYCDQCQFQWNEPCPFGHHTLQLNYNSDGSSRCPSKLPVNLKIARSKIPEAAFGIFAEAQIPAGVVWGPFTGFQYSAVAEFFTPGDILQKAKPPKTVSLAHSWMDKVNFGRVRAEYNTIFFFYKGELYFKTLRSISPKEEILLTLWPENLLCQNFVKNDALAGNIVLRMVEERKRKLVKSKKQGETGRELREISSPLDELSGAVNSLVIGKSPPSSGNGPEAEVNKHELGVKRTSIEVSCARSTSPAAAKVVTVGGVKGDGPDTSKPTPQVEGDEAVGLHLASGRSTSKKERPYACTTCEARFSRASHLRLHERTHTGERPYACTACKARFSQASHLRLHERTHTGERPYACTVCEARFSEAGNLRKHERTHTGERPYACTTCEARFSRADNLREHERTHTGERPYACTTCEARFSQAGSLRLHERTHTGERPYACTACEARFSQASHLRLHERTHTGERPYACTVCEARFSKAGNLRKHERTHTGERPYACTTCEARFSRADNLREHERTHTGERPYACTTCEARFSRADNLREHERTHTGERPYACTTCEARFSQAGDLREHERTHTGERPYACTTCEARFSQAGSLRLRERTHTGERPYACTACEARFSKGCNLRTHERTHTGERPYACTTCEARFSEADSLRTHERTHRR